MRSLGKSGHRRGWSISLPSDLITKSWCHLYSCLSLVGMATMIVIDRATMNVIEQL